MSQTGRGVRNPQSSTSAAAPPGATSQLVGLYDEFAELVALNNFLYDAFLSLSAEAGSALSAQTASGLGVTCQWLRQRQLLLKEEFYQLIQLSKAAEINCGVGTESKRE